MKKKENRKLSQDCRIKQDLCLLDPGCEHGYIIGEPLCDFIETETEYKEFQLLMDFYESNVSEEEWKRKNPASRKGAPHLRKLRERRTKKYPIETEKAYRRTETKRDLTQGYIRGCSVYGNQYICPLDNKCKNWWVRGNPFCKYIMTILEYKEFRLRKDLREREEQEDKNHE